MKKINIFISLLLIVNNNITAQRFGWSLPSQINVNNSSYSNENRREIINATVRLAFVKNGVVSGYCTGTLINRNTSDSNIGFYVITARHCFFENNGMGSMDFDSNAEHYVIFNYQSAGALNGSTANSNVGSVHKQSEHLNDTGYEYFHKTKLRLVNYFLWGDFALIEILKPVPPHFNFTYAGWHSGGYGTIIYFTNTQPMPFVGIHHPRGDIKKISGAKGVIWGETPIATGCYFVTGIIDFLFGWIWGHSASTRVICNYVDNPWFFVPGYNYGSMENGSSGSGLFLPNNRLLGVLSGPLNSYGKLHANYNNASIKNTLNPSHGFWVDNSGLSSRKITKYNNLLLPNAYNDTQDGYYFPANHYQPVNRVTLQAANNIETVRPITVFSGADYEFVAGNEIILRNGFIAQSGSTFTARINSSLRSETIEELSIEEQMLEKLRVIDLPEKLEFNKKKYLEESEPDLALSQSCNVLVFPNPATDIINIMFDNVEKMQNLGIYSLTGDLVYEKNITSDHQTINVREYPTGLYILKIFYKNGESEFVKIIIN